MEKNRNIVIPVVSSVSGQETSTEISRAVQWPTVFDRILMPISSLIHLCFWGDISFHFYVLFLLLCLSYNRRTSMVQVLGEDCDLLKKVYLLIRTEHNNNKSIEKEGKKIKEKRRIPTTQLMFPAPLLWLFVPEKVASLGGPIWHNEYSLVLLWVNIGGICVRFSGLVACLKMHSLLSFILRWKANFLVLLLGCGNWCGVQIHLCVPK